MQFPESWLRSWCNPPLSTQELADTLTMAGLEVEETRPVAPPFSGVVVARIVSAEPHPDADKLRVCQVEAGAASRDGPLQIVCGAPNARAGILVPLATVGAQLPPVPAADGTPGKPFTIGVGKLRGVQSFGMLCSARELGLSQDHAGLLELPSDLVPGTDIRTALDLDDTVFTLKLTPNLGHLLGVYGIARELSALTGAPLKAAVFTPATVSIDETVPVAIEAPDLCGRFSGRVIRDVNPAATTPSWMVERLARCGQRSVTPLVDISNYVMFEFGRPTHMFDRDRIHGGLHVRWARDGETLTLLNGATATLDRSYGVIADDREIESLAGIMGGDATAVSDATRNIYLEAAFWWPEAIAGRARKLNFSTDAGHRFERGVDAESTVEHIEHITALVQQICGGRAGPVTDTVTRLPERKPVTLRADRASRVLGMPVTIAQCEQAFARLGMPAQRTAEPDADGRGGAITVTPPSWRFDLAIEEDLIEEVIRVVGLKHLPATPPIAPVTAQPQPESVSSRYAVRHRLAALGYQETITFSFVEEASERELAGNPNPIRVLNPIAAPLAVMRSSLVGSLLEVMKTNVARRAARGRVFEVGRVFRRDASVADTLRTVAGIDQPLRVAGLAWGANAPLQWAGAERERAVDFYDAKGDVEALLAPRVATFVADTHPAMHPGRCARVEVDGRAIGHVGELHPRWRQQHDLPSAPVLFELDFAAVRERRVPQFAPIARQQAALRDVALVADARTPHDTLVGALRDDPQGLVQRATLFDVYVTPADRAHGGGAPGAGGAESGVATGGVPAGQASFAIRLELLDPQATLTDERIDAAVTAAVARAGERCGARLRA